MVMRWRICIAMKADNGYVPATEGYERARELAQHALQLSPDLAEAHATLQYVYHDVRLGLGSRGEPKCSGLSPLIQRIRSALYVAGHALTTLGHWDDAERQFRAALVRDPLNPYVIWNLGNTYYLAGRFAESEAMYRKLLEIAPDFVWTRTYLAKTLLAQGKPEAALAMVQEEVDEGDRLAYPPICCRPSAVRPRRTRR